MQNNKLVRDLFRFLLLDRKDIGLILVYGASSGLLTLFLPLSVQYIFSNISYKTIFQPVLVIALILLTMLFLSMLFRAMQVFLVEMIQRKIFVRSTLSITQFVPRIRFAEFFQVNAVELMNRFFEILHIQKIQALFLMDGIGLILQTIIGMGFLAFYHPFFLAYDMALVVALYFVIYRLGFGGIETSIYESKCKYQVAAWLEETARSKKSFHSTRGREFVMEKADGLITDYLKARKSHFAIVFRQTLSSYGLYIFASVLLIVMGSSFVIKGELSVGQLVAAEIVVTNVLISFTKLGKYLESGYDLVTSFDKLGHIFDLETEEESKVNIAKPEGVEIRLENLTCHFGNEGRRIGPFNLTISPGKKVVFFGEYGSGKSTLSQILAGFIAPKMGTYYLNGVKSSDMGTSLMRDLVILVSRPEIFNGTVLENLTLSSENLLDEDLMEKLRLMGLWDSLNLLPGKFDTIVVKTEHQISRHIAAMISIARAVFQNPNVLILDDILDHFDRKAAVDLMLYFRKYHPDMTVVVFSTTKRLNAQFDEVLLLPSPEEASV